MLKIKLFDQNNQHYAGYKQPKRDRAQIISQPKSFHKMKILEREREKGQYLHGKDLKSLTGWTDMTSDCSTCAQESPH